jgi:hypothetical protein
VDRGPDVLRRARRSGRRRLPRAHARRVTAHGRPTGMALGGDRRRGRVPDRGALGPHVHRAGDGPTHAAAQRGARRARRPIGSAHRALDREPVPHAARPRRRFARSRCAMRSRRLTPARP